MGYAFSITEIKVRRDRGNKLPHYGDRSRLLLGTALGQFSSSDFPDFNQTEINIAKRYVVIGQHL